MSIGADLERERARVMSLVEHASVSWAEAMRAHVMAPPDAGFAARLRNLSEAAAIEQLAWERAHAAGLMWRPFPDGEPPEPPYELRPGTARRGPEDLWQRFDVAVGALNVAITRPDTVALVGAFAEMANVAADLADAVERLDELAREAQARARARGVA
jgi:hypothetical protein